MRMTRIEKYFVNRKKKSAANIKILESDLLLIDLKKIKTVLEIGCGIGFVSSYIAETYNMKVFGTDSDTEQIQLANQLQPESEYLHYQVEDAAKLSFEDSSIDLVISQNVFHHIPEWEQVIKEISRILVPGGYFNWVDLTIPKIVKSVFKPFVKNYGLYTIDDIEKSFKSYGFKKIISEHLLHGPLVQYHYLFVYP
jgi:cyclopropane fatty-acyl-phospholipid synthase-like methyltransferase